ncbi:MAG TPA: aminopeptidase P N-terminal domain-containing protein [Oscillatoriaceae cyanobacterium]
MPDATTNLYAERRRRFMQQMEGGAALIPGAATRIRSRDTDYRYRPDSDLVYLTGFREPGSALLLLPNHPEHRTVMFVQPKDPAAETWNGRRLGAEAAPATLGVDAAYSIDDLEAVLRKYLTGTERLYYGFGTHQDMDRLVLELLPKLGSRNVEPPSQLVDPGTILHEMRLRKDETEIALMRKAAAITAEGYAEAIAAIRPGAGEWEVQAALEYAYRRLGGEGSAYNAIVASGDNATILHYTENDRVMHAGELLLIDSGAEYKYYACDVTRTYPVSGKFTDAQRAVYDLVLRANQEAITYVRPGEHVKRYHLHAVEVLTEGMVKLGLLKGDVKTLIEQEAYRRFYMHGTGHYLGLDTHDVGRYKLKGAWRALEPGMVVTVEPGLYVAAGATDVDPAFWGIGVRIEDDVLVTSGGNEVLTAAIPKASDELETLLQKRAAVARV